MIDPTQNPGYVINDLAEFINRRMRDVSASLNCCLIGTIKAVNFINQTVTVACVFQKVVKGVVPIPNSDLMGDQTLNYPLLVNVPFIFLQGGSSYITMPIAIGDTCLVFFCDRDMDNWVETGVNPAPPNSDRVHSINDAIALVGIRSFQNPLPAYNSSVIQIVDQTGERLPQSGMMNAYGGSTAPAGWLLCDGSSYSRTTYATLFAIIGTTYGSVDGTHFNVPNMQGQVPAGYKSGDPSFGTLGAQLGEQTHTLINAEIPDDNLSGREVYIAGSGASNLVGGSTIVGITVATKGGGAHNNIQPSLTVNWIIKI